MTRDRTRVDHVLNLLGDLSIDELEQISKALKKMLFRCQVQEKIDLRRDDLAQRLSLAMSHSKEKVREEE